MSETMVAGRGLQLSNGDHVCVFCRGGERDELLVPFLADGLAGGDRCLAVLDTSEPGDLLNALGTGGGDVHEADQLTALASGDVYPPTVASTWRGCWTSTGPSCGASPRPVRLRPDPHGRGDDLGAA